MSSHFARINKLLDHFDDYQKQVDSVKPDVNIFLQKLKSKLVKRKSFVSHGSKFVKIGSSYEDTVVSPFADFDIAMILPAPFRMDNFELVETNDAGFYKMKFVDENSDDFLEQYLNSNDFLKVEELKNKIFNELISIIESIAMNEYTISYHLMGSSVSVKLKNSAETIKLDIVPQIAASLHEDNIPGWYNYDLPNVMQNFINNQEYHILFNLSAPPDLQENYKHLIVQPAFNLMEKECMLESEVVADSVRIAKAVSKHHKWMKDGLRSFHIKRIAMHFYDEIESLGDSWDGYQTILSELIHMLEDGEISGCFITDQNIICKDEEECHDLADKMTEARGKINPTNILKVLNIN